MKSKIEEEVIEIILKEAASLSAIEKEDFDTALSDLGVDSLDQSSMFLEFEEKYDIEFSDENIDNLPSLNKIVQFIQSNIE